MDEKLPVAPGVDIPARTEFLVRRPARRRVNMHCTVHPQTLERLDALASKFESHRGQLIDKLVAILDQAYESGKMHCLHGQVCQLGRTDLPKIF